MYSPELVDQVLRYINNEINLQDLEAWIVSHSPELIRNPETDDADLVAEIELQLAEFSDGLRSENQVKEELRTLLSYIVSFYPEKPHSYSKSSSSTTLVEVLK